MEQRHTDTELVILREAHILAREVAVVRNAVVRQHNALGESRGATGVLHVADIVARHLALHLIQRLVLNVLSQQQQLSGIIHTTIFLHTDVDNALQIREALAVQMTALAGLQFGQHRICHVDIITVPCSVCNTQNLHIGVLTQILQFVLFVVGVYRHKYGTYLGGSVEEGQPVGHIGGPDTDV